VSCNALEKEKPKSACTNLILRPVEAFKYQSELADNGKVAVDEEERGRPGQPPTPVSLDFSADREGVVEVQNRKGDGGNITVYISILS
jgi:hypothetical protein